MDPFTAVPHARTHLLREGPGHRRDVQPRPALRGAEGRALRQEDRASPTPSTRARGSSSSSSTRSASTRTTTTATTTSTPRRAPGTRAREHGRQEPRLPARATSRATSRCPPMDQYQDLRSRDGAEPREGRHPRSRCTTTRSATAGQTEIDMRFDTLLKMADNVLWYKYVRQEHREEVRARPSTFMPKPLFQDNGSGMHTHQSPVEDGKNLFYERGRLRRHLRRCAATTSAAS